MCGGPPHRVTCGLIATLRTHTHTAAAPPPQPFLRYHHQVIHPNSTSIVPEVMGCVCGAAWVCFNEWHPGGGGGMGEWHRGSFFLLTFHGFRFVLASGRFFFFFFWFFLWLARMM